MFPEGPDTVEPPPERAERALADDQVSTRADDGSVIDILVAYTRPALLDGFGSDTRAWAEIDLAVAETNQALRNTGLNIRLRLVHVVGVAYTEAAYTGGGDDLNRLQTPNDGFLDDLLDLRDRYAADLVTLIVTRGQSRASLGFPSNTGRCCFGAINGVSGAGRINGGGFAHEIGHNLGAHHDWYDTADPGAYPYSKGFVSLPGRVNDLMAGTDLMAGAALCRHAGTTCTGVLAYSNPNLTHNGHRLGVPVGTSVACRAGNVNNPPCDADIARTFVQMAPVVARYRHSLTALSARQLLPGGTFRSANGRFRLTYQTDGNLVLYDDRDGVALWSTNTGGTAAGQAILQTDGNFVVYDRNGTALWTSQTPGNSNAYLVVEDDGNFAIYESDGQLVWDRIGSPVPENWFAPAASSSVLGIDFRVFNGNIVQMAIEHRIDNIGVPGNTCTARVSQTNISIPIVDGKFTVPFSVDGLSTVVSGTFTSPTAGTGTVDSFHYANWRCPGAPGARNGVLAGITPISFSRR